MLDEDLYWMMPWMPCHKLRVFCIAKATLDHFCIYMFWSWTAWKSLALVVLRLALFLDRNTPFFSLSYTSLSLMSCWKNRAFFSSCGNVLEDGDILCVLSDEGGHRFSVLIQIHTAIMSSCIFKHVQVCVLKTIRQCWDNSTQPESDGSSGRSGAFQQWCVWRPHQHCSLV